MPNPVLHFEVTTTGDPASLQDFYRNAFDWKIDADNDMKYGMVDNAGDGINGGVGPSPEGHLTFYIQVPNLEAALEKIEGLGGKVATPPMDVPGGPRIAHFTDPVGHFVGLLQG